MERPDQETRGKQGFGCKCVTIWYDMLSFGIAKALKNATTTVLKKLLIAGMLNPLEVIDLLRTFFLQNFMLITYCISSVNPPTGRYTNGLCLFY